MCLTFAKSEYARFLYCMPNVPGIFNTFTALGQESKRELQFLIMLLSINCDTMAKFYSSFTVPIYVKLASLKRIISPFVSPSLLSICKVVIPVVCCPDCEWLQIFTAPALSPLAACELSLIHAVFLRYL